MKDQRSEDPNSSVASPRLLDLQPPEPRPLPAAHGHIVCRLLAAARGPRPHEAAPSDDPRAIRHNHRISRRVFFGKHVRTCCTAFRATTEEEDVLRVHLQPGASQLHRRNGHLHPEVEDEPLLRGTMALPHAAVGAVRQVCCRVPVVVPLRAPVDNLVGHRHGGQTPFVVGARLKRFGIRTLSAPPWLPASLGAPVAVFRGLR
mmetsp:Transcript_4636/g.14029  ORF Transcript_4636/g.14029 Transcript_4636/m.14029 type:complete len:203 (+) Transcript_4636:1504-2112(+)